MLDRIRSGFQNIYRTAGCDSIEARLYIPGSGKTLCKIKAKEGSAISRNDAYPRASNRGLISKVSEIDSVRQFTTRYDLARLVNVLKESQVRK
jgi:hypothetical protein